LGGFASNGFVKGLSFVESDVFVMPEPYESAATARSTLDELAAYFQ
jgi:hypothetical protein